jgi:hypothetical protein
MYPSNSSSHDFYWMAFQGLTVTASVKLWNSAWTPREWMSIDSGQHFAAGGIHAGLAWELHHQGKLINFTHPRRWSSMNEERNKNMWIILKDFPRRNNLMPKSVALLADTQDDAPQPSTVLNLEELLGAYQSNLTQLDGAPDDAPQSSTVQSHISPSLELNAIHQTNLTQRGRGASEMSSIDQSFVLSCKAFKNATAEEILCEQERYNPFVLERLQLQTFAVICQQAIPLPVTKLKIGRKQTPPEKEMQWCNTKKCEEKQMLSSTKNCARKLASVMPISSGRNGKAPGDKMLLNTTRKSSMAAKAAAAAAAATAPAATATATAAAARERSQLRLK